MARERPRKTLADYAVIAISPALIMLLVGSLVFFLLQVAYHGHWEDRLRWILFWFVFASVLIARIGIEQGSDYARLYGLGLAAATALVIFKFVDAPLIALGLLAVVWWCANKLTWDCTLVDDRVDASGEGLLERCLGSNATTLRAEPGPQPRELGAPLRSDPSHPTAGTTHAPGLWVVYFSLAALPIFGIGQLLIPAHEETARTYGFQLLCVYVAAALGLLLTTSFLGLRRYLRQRRLSMPAAIAGNWLGLGSLLIAVILAVCVLLPRPQADYSLTAMLDKLSEKQQRASKHALLRGEGAEKEGRRIGRKKQDAEKDEQHDQKPEEGQDEDRSAGQGPQREQAQRKTETQQHQNRAPDDAQTQEQTTAQSQTKSERQSKQQDRSGSSADQRQGEQRSAEQPQGEQRPGEQRPGERKQGDRQNNRSRFSDDQRQADRNEQAQQDEQHSNESGQQKPGNKGERNVVAKEKQRENQPSEPAAPARARSSPWDWAWLTQFAKWIVYAVLAAVVLWIVFKNGSQLLDAMRQLWEQLLGLFGLSAREPNPDEATPASAAQPRRHRPFAAFDNPFLTGASGRMKPETLAVYSFEALEAWACERGIERSAEQTPIEFVRMVRRRFPEMKEDLKYAGQLYARVAYADYVPSREDADRLDGLWRKMSAAGSLVLG